MIDDPEKVAMIMASRNNVRNTDPDYKGNAAGTPVYPKDLSDTEIKELLSKVPLSLYAIVGRYEPLRIDIMDANTNELQMHFHPVDRNKTVTTPANWQDTATLIINLFQVIKKLKENQNGTN